IRLVKNMRKFWTVFSHTYLSKLKSKSFIITTLIVLILMAGVSNIDHIIDLFSGEDNADEVIVIDHSNDALDALVNMSENNDVSAVPFHDTVAGGKKAVESAEYEGLMGLEKGGGHTIGAVVYENDASSTIQMELQSELQQVKIALATEESGVDAETLENIYADMTFEHVALDESAKTEEGLNSTRGIIYVMLFVLYITVLLYGQMIATEVATEKSSRVMEILISSASP